MKRHALLIGYSGWDIPGKKPLSGVIHDLDGYYNYLQSLNGGAWDDNEITRLYDKDLTRLRTEMIKIKAQHNDVVYVIYSGHGCYNTDKYCRELEISNNDSIYETDLSNFASKQVLILDSCAGYYSEMINESISIKALLERASASEGKILAKRKFEELCNNCINQKLYFYAAKRGTTAQDTTSGGSYSQALLRTLKSANKMMDMFEAHNIASEIVLNETNNEQEPEYRVPKICNFLPGNINYKEL